MVTEAPIVGFFSGREGGGRYFYELLIYDNINTIINLISLHLDK